ncbi:MAG: hypothetical protein ACRYE9_00185 [Janthinobacterium lividum]
MKDIDKGFEKIGKLLKQLNKISLKAGVLSESDSKPKGGESIAEYAYYNEVGTDRIPARPFMSLTADEQKDNWSNLMTKSFDKMLVSGGKDLEVELGRVGERMINDIKETISSNISPVNAPSTIKRKKSSKTLIDTGLLRQSIKWQISQD